MGHEGLRPGRRRSAQAGSAPLGERGFGTEPWCLLRSVWVDFKGRPEGHQPFWESPKKKCGTSCLPELGVLFLLLLLYTFGEILRGNERERRQHFWGSPMLTHRTHFAKPSFPPCWQFGYWHEQPDVLQVGFSRMRVLPCPFRTLVRSTKGNLIAIAKHS